MQTNIVLNTAAVKSIIPEEARLALQKTACEKIAEEITRKARNGSYQDILNRLSRELNDSVSKARRTLEQEIRGGRDLPSDVQERLLEKAEAFFLGIEKKIMERAEAAIKAQAEAVEAAARAAAVKVIKEGMQILSDHAEKTAKEAAREEVLVLLRGLGRVSPAASEAG